MSKKTDRGLWTGSCESAYLSAVYNILQELQGKYAPNRAKIKIYDWVSRLTVENNAFGGLMANL